MSTTREQVTRGISVVTKRGLLAKHSEGMLISEVRALKCMVERASRDA